MEKLGWLEDRLWKIVTSAVSGTWLFNFHTLEGFAKGIVLCSIVSEAKKILEQIKLLLKPSKTLLECLIPSYTCYGTSWYTRKQEKLERIKSLGIAKAYEDEASRTRNVRPAPTALLEVKQALEKWKGKSLKWMEDKESEENRISTYRTLLFGGPVSNRYSEWLVDESPVKFDFNSPNHDLITEDEEKFSPDYDFNKKTYRSDYAVIIFKEKTKFAPKGVAGFMGCHGYGTLASARILTNSDLSGVKKVARKVASQLKSGEDFYTVLEVEVDRGEIEKVEVVKIVKF